MDCSIRGDTLDYQALATDIALRIHCDILMVDFTLYPMRARMGQEKMLGYLIGGIASQVDSRVVLVEPKTIRKWLGLSNRSSKSAVWEAFDSRFPDILKLCNTEHEKDATILARYGVDLDNEGRY
jgi:hypothetical protein